MCGLNPVNPRTQLTMYIKAHRDGLQSITTPEMGSLAEFSDNNIARVTESDGKVLLDKYPDEFDEHNPEDN